MSRRLLILCAAAVVSAGAGAAEAKPMRNCPVISADSDQVRAGGLRTRYSTEGFQMRRQYGVSACSFHAPGRGVCSLKDSGLVHVRTARTDTYFNIPLGRPARLEIDGGAVRCTMPKVY
jgi:hypothetical protein